MVYKILPNQFNFLHNLKQRGDVSPSDDTQTQMKNLKLHFASMLLVVVASQTETVAQQKKPTTGTRTYVPSTTQRKAPTPAYSTPKPAQSVVNQSTPPPVQKTTQTYQQESPKQPTYNKYQESEERAYPKSRDENPDFSSVIKLNYSALIIGGISLDYEKRMAEKTSLILTGGYYGWGLLKGNFRVGLDYRQYLGNSYVPKGLFVSLGAVGNFFPIKSTIQSSTSVSTKSQSIVWVNTRLLFGYQGLTGNFTFEAALGPAYGFLLSTEQKNLNESIKVGFLPAAKLSIGYAF